MGSVVFLVVAVLAALLTLADVPPAAPRGLALVSFAGALLAWGTFIVSGFSMGRRRRRTWSELVKYSEDDRSWYDALPTRVIAPVGACMLVLVVTTLVGVTAMSPGVTQEVDGRYYSNNHGDMTEITEDEYRRAAGAETRMLAAVAGGFLSVSAIGAGARRNRLRCGGHDLNSSNNVQTEA